MRRAASGYERVAVERGTRSGALLTVAVHSTRLGPALGGARMWHYPDPDDAVADAMRLAQAMTYKAAAAGLDLGGGKGVIAAPEEARPEGELRRALLLDFGDLVESLGGSYVTAEDVGTSAEDMDVIAARTAHVVGRDPGRGGSGDPSPVTALGVLAAIRACVAHRYPARLPGAGLSGLRVIVIGAGHVGSELIRLLAADGAEVQATDVRADLRGQVEMLGARWIEPGDALLAPADVLAPCALGGLVDEGVARALRCEILCGAANNVLTDDRVADILARRGILYAPDFVANAGGLISVAAELAGTSHAEALEAARGIEQAVARVLEIADADGLNPLVAARHVAELRLGTAPSRARRPARLAG
jgi:leucine dehydrogenase